MSDRRVVQSSASRASTPENGLSLACPYAKHDPIKYSHSHKNKNATESYRYRTCTTGYHADLTRLKQHLERNHTLHPCPRCKQALPNKASLERHSEGPCEPVPELSREGWMSKAQAEAIKERTKGNPTETWNRMYRILFPQDEIPDSPYAEYVTGEDLRDCLEYVSEHLPRLLRNIAQQEISSTQYGHFLTNGRDIRRALAQLQNDFRRESELEHVLPEMEVEGPINPPFDPNQHIFQQPPQYPPGMGEQYGQPHFNPNFNQYGGYDPSGFYRH